MTINFNLCDQTFSEALDDTQDSTDLIIIAYFETKNESSCFLLSQSYNQLLMA